MSIIAEAINKLNKLIDSIDDTIKVRVFVEPDIDESSPDGNGGYDDQTLEEWYDFAGTVEGIIRNFASIESISTSSNSDSLSEYIDFYCYDDKGNCKNYIIDLRLSDHRQTTGGRNKRIKNVSKLNTNYKLVGITVNDKTFYSYSQAENYIRKILADDLLNN